MNTPTFLTHPLPVAAPRPHHSLPPRTPRAAARPHPPSPRPLVSRRLAIATIAQLLALPHLPAARATSSHRVFFDISIAGRPRGRIVVQLDPSLAPVSTDTFESLAAGTLRNRAGRTATYRYAQASRVIRGRRVDLGKLNQIDSLNQQPGVPQRLQTLVDVPLNNDSNSVSHDRPGLVSVARGGAFSFSILTQPDPSLDETNLVVGSVVEGMDLVLAMANVPTNRKTIRDGYRSVGKIIGDSRANVELEDKPLQKILISDCGLL